MKKTSRKNMARAFVSLLERYPGQKLAVALAQLLVQQGLTQDVDLLLAQIADQLLVQQGILSVQLTSARELSAAVVKEIKQLLKQRAGAQQVELEQRQDPVLLGGMVAVTPRFEVEWSIRQQLDQLTK